MEKEALDQLPPLPEPRAWMVEWPQHAPSFTRDKSDYVLWHLGKASYPDRMQDLFTAEQMREYARAALASPVSPALAVPPAIQRIVALLHTQDNRITSHPLFAVQQKRTIGGLDEEYADKFAWVGYDGECSQEDSNLYDAKRENGDPLPDGVRRVGFIEKWEFVTGCMTEQGCKDFIACNGHNLTEPRIYAYSGYRNAEFIALREWLMSLSTPPASISSSPERHAQAASGMTMERRNG